MQLGGESFWNRPSFLYIFVFGLLIVGMFFIPEILGYFGVNTGEQVLGSMAKASLNRAQNELIEGAESIKSSVGEITSDTEANDASVQEASLSTSPLEDVLGQLDAPAPKAAEQTEGKTPASEGGISWDSIRGKDSARQLSQARADYQKLANALPERYRHSKYALLNYANGIGFVLSDGSASLSSEQAVRYLEDLDYEVEQSFRDENVERSYFLSWRDVTLGPVFKATRLGRDKVIPPFKPNFWISYVRVQQPSDHYGRYSYQGDAYLYLLGRISSEDVKRVELFRNGVSQGDVVLAPVDKTSAVRELVFNRLDARGVYALRFYDQTGATYTESYEFLSRAVKYPWDSDSGDYQLPFVQNSKDPRMTTSFRLESSGSGARSGNGDFLFSSSNRNFVTF